MSKYSDNQNDYSLQSQSQQQTQQNQSQSTYDPSASDNSNLMVNYFPPSLTDDELRGLFAPYGIIESCKIVKDKSTGLSMCYGFVKYSNNESANQAQNALNGLPMEAKKMKVTIARPLGEKPPKSQYGKAPFQRSNGNNFQPYGKPSYPSGPGGYADPSMGHYSQQGGSAYPHHGGGGYPQQGGGYPPQNGGYQQDSYGSALPQQQPRGAPLPLGLYIFNLPQACNDDVLNQLFAPYGNITSCKVMADSQGICRGFGFVNMTSNAESDMAIAALNGVEWGGKKLKVQFQNPKQKQRD